MLRSPCSERPLAPARESRVLPSAAALLSSMAWVLASAAPPLGAQTLEIVRICAAIANETARLSCYDRLVETMGVSAAGPEGTLWEVEFTVDPLTDARTARATLPALQGTGADGRPIQLLFICAAGRTDAFLDWGYYLPGQREVLLRLDDDGPQPTFWEPEANSTRARYRNEGDVLARILVPRRRLVARVAPPRRDPITAVFDLTGMDDAMTPLREACGW